MNVVPRKTFETRALIACVRAKMKWFEKKYFFFCSANNERIYWLVIREYLIILSFVAVPSVGYIKSFQMNIRMPGLKIHMSYVII